MVLGVIGAKPIFRSLVVSCLKLSLIEVIYWKQLFALQLKSQVVNNGQFKLSSINYNRFLSLAYEMSSRQKFLLKRSRALVEPEYKILQIPCWILAVPCNSLQSVQCTIKSCHSLTDFSSPVNVIRNLAVSCNSLWVSLAHKAKLSNSKWLVSLSER